MGARSSSRQSNRFVSAVIPSGKVECAYYFAVFYSLASEGLGISLPLLAGVSILTLSIICFVQLRSCAKTVYGPIGFLVGCAVSFGVIQVAVHDVSLLDSNLRAFIIWILQLIIVHSLCLRQGFSVRRYPIVLFLFALAMLPFLTFDPGEMERARVNVELGIGGGLTHPGGIAEWFGFFAVYFAVRGVENKRLRIQICMWLLALGCLSLSVLAVSRAVLFAVALSLTVAFRGLLRHGFVPLLMIVTLTGVVYATGLFDLAISHYSSRGMEETGRELLWPRAIERIFNSPFATLFGVSEPEVGMYVLSPTIATAPHNAFLRFWLSSGVLPFALFLAFWIQAAWKSRTHRDRQEFDAYRLPFLLFTFVDIMFGDTSFMAPWALLAMSVAAGSAVVYSKQRLVSVRIGNEMRVGILPAHKLSEPSTMHRSRS
jgi:hypothetical protein